jgi:hypothetical protein
LSIVAGRSGENAHDSARRLILWQTVAVFGLAVRRGDRARWVARRRAAQSCLSGGCGIRRVVGTWAGESLRRLAEGGVPGGDGMLITRLVAAVAVAAVGLFATTASAGVISGAEIGQMAGQMVAQQEAAQREAACRAGAPPSDGAITAVTARMQRVMDSYLALTAKADSHAIGRVFALKTTGVRWRDGNGVVPIAQLADHLTPPPAQPVLKVVVVGADGESGRGIWTVTPPGAEAPTVVYAVDVMREDGHPFDYALGYRVLHMTVAPSSDSPPPPGAYCHLDVDHGY